MSALTDRVTGLLEAASASATPDVRAELERARERLHGPLRVAIAGRVKAGKSTLLNALVGAELAPTDARECTRIVTWYEHGLTYQVHAHPVGGGVPEQVPFRRDAGTLEVDLGARRVEDVARLVVSWPTRRLETLTLIDTPGIGSVNAEVSARTEQFLTDHDAPEEADAVVYLLRHLHGDDVRFLEAFHDDDLAHATPVTALGVLSRADEIGAARLDALDSARRIAGRYSADPRVRRLCQVVVPVAGLVAQAGATLVEDEYRAIVAIATLDDAERDGLLLSADRVVADSLRSEPTPLVRAHLLDRLGLFGVRLAVDLVRSGRANSATELAGALVAASGLDDLRAVLDERFAGRAEVLKARSALNALDALLSSGRLVDASVARSLEEVLSSAHELAELRVSNALRSGSVELREAEQVAAEQLLGGGDVRARFGLDAGVDDATVRVAAADALERWQRRAESPLASPEVVAAARVLARSCEGVLVELATEQTPQ